jgi:chromate transporter
MAEPLANTWKDIAIGFLKVGATAYGGPAIMGIMQAEFQERRQWTSKPHFLEGMALVNVLPGATATQLGIFLGYVRGGWWGGLLAGLCFAAPAFIVMLALTIAYAALGVSPILRGALYGLGPVVLAIFFAALVRLGKSVLRSWTHGLIALGAAIAALLGPLGAAAILLLAGGVGLFLFHSKRLGTGVLVGVAVAVALLSLAAWSPLGSAASPAPEPTLGRVASLFAAIGAFTFGGGLTMIALLEEHVVNHLHWLTPREFVDGLALGQLTPGPVLMLAAYVGSPLSRVRWPRRSASSSPSTCSWSSRFRISIGSAAIRRSKGLSPASRRRPRARSPEPASCWLDAPSSISRRS